MDTKDELKTIQSLSKELYDREKKLTEKVLKSKCEKCKHWKADIPGYKHYTALNELGRPYDVGPEWSWGFLKKENYKCFKKVFSTKYSWVGEKIVDCDFYEKKLFR
ncbi:MAG: hypothetical protein GY853_02085 [PVC group bacterium]|nr:hypothetical protein [PVC group bacterium]